MFFSQRIIAMASRAPHLTPYEVQLPPAGNPFPDPRKFGVTLVQIQLGGDLTYTVNKLLRARCHFICFPDYLLGPGTEGGVDRIDARIVHAHMRRLSLHTGAWVIGGTMIERVDGQLCNIATLYGGDKIIDRLEKINPTDSELRHGVVPGDRLPIYIWGDLRFSVLICSDVALGTDVVGKWFPFDEAIFDLLAQNRVQILFLPVLSPAAKGETRPILIDREAALCRMAARANCTIVKVGGVYNRGGVQALGRSLVISPAGRVIARVTDETTPQSLTAEISL